ncbi:MAG: hypothetical protein Q4E50_07230 [Tissierellia bacterium]|nr:hypothetical protein [Tissierellia bacterium]
MNATVIHGDTLNRSAKQIYFIQNSKEVMDYFNIEVWEEDGCKHAKVIWGS